MAPTRCPLCGTAGSACGPQRPVTPIDIPTLATPKEPDMAQLSDYDVVVNGLTTTLRLSAADAKKRGLTKTAAEAKADAEAEAQAKAEAEAQAKAEAEAKAKAEAEAKKAAGSK